MATHKTHWVELRLTFQICKFVKTMPTGCYNKKCKQHDHDYQEVGLLYHDMMFVCEKI